MRRRYILDKREYKRDTVEDRQDAVIILSPRTISSPEALLGGQLARSIRALHLDYSWMTMGPCRLGIDSIFGTFGIWKHVGHHLVVRSPQQAILTSL